MTTTKHNTRNPSALKPHPLLKDSPMLDPDHADCRFIRASIADGWRESEPIQINDRDQIIDGRHRVREAIALGMESVPVSIIPDTEAIAVMVHTYSARRHMAKWQTVYTLGPVIEQYFGDGKGRRISNLIPAARHKKAKNANVLSKPQPRIRDSEQKGLNPFQTFLSHIGISQDTWGRANAVRTKFAEHPELRARFEPLMFTDDPDRAMSLEAVIKALGSITGEYAKGRVDLIADRSEHHRLLSEYFEKVTKQFKFWKKLDPSHRRAVSAALVTESRVWPAEVRLAMLTELRENPPRVQEQDGAEEG